MRNKARILFITGLIFLFQHFLIAQSNDQYVHKVGIIDSIFSSTLNESREFYVQLPASFNPESKQSYPGVYILDGEVLLPTVNNVHEFYSGGFMPEMILIGISNSKNRNRDLTTSKMNMNYGGSYNEENGEADNFIKFIEEELIPYIEEKYPISSFRTLIGHSYGGLFTVNALINHSHLFDNYIAIDPSLDWDNQKLLKQASDLIPTQNFNGKSLYMTLSGQLHMQNPHITIDNVMQDSTGFTLFARSNIMFSNLVRKNEQNGLFFDWKFYPRELHGTIPLPSIMDGLISLFEWFQMENTDRFNSPETPKEELYDIIKYRANKLQTHFGYQVSPYPEELLNMLGYMSIDMEQFDKAKMFFEFGIEYFPQSMNAYDSMADYYETQNDIVSALEFVKKAYDLNGSDHLKERIERLKAIK